MIGHDGHFKDDGSHLAFNVPARFGFRPKFASKPS